MSSKFLTNQVALVTGASRGLGKAIALALAQEGASIAAVARSEDALQDTLAAIRTAGGVAEPFALDVADGVAVESTVEKITARFEHIDILVNNAGVTRDGLLARMSSELGHRYQYEPEGSLQPDQAGRPSHGQATRGPDH